MPIVLIDIYTMPDEAAATFVERARPIQTLLKTLPGFIEGHLHECMAGDSPFRFVSTAVWADEAALDNARNAVSAEIDASVSIRRPSCVRTVSSADGPSIDGSATEPPSAGVAQAGRDAVDGQGDDFA